MAYLLLAAAIASEITATAFLKYSGGFSRFWPTVFCAFFYFLCHLSFGKAIMRLNLGAAYAIWCGVGIIVTMLISIFVFRERLTPAGFFGMACIVTGCVLVNLSGTGA